MQEDDFIEGFQWVAALDARTCLRCAARDSLKYTKSLEPIGHLVPWGKGPGRIHHKCRCIALPLIDSRFDFLNKGATRASVNGPVPQDLSYHQWLKEQPEEFIREVLGRDRATIWRINNLHLMDLLGPDGRPLKVSELQEKYGTANGRL